jgi:hypothetical protein
MMYWKMKRHNGRRKKVRSGGGGREDYFKGKGWDEALQLTLKFLRKKEGGGGSMRCGGPALQRYNGSSNRRHEIPLSSTSPGVLYPFVETTGQNTKHKTGACRKRS